MPTILSLITAFGLGSIATTIIQSWAARRAIKDERGFREKQAAYIGLLEAYHKAAVEGTDEAGKLFAYWQMRCELVGSPLVCDAVECIVTTNDDPAGRTLAHQDLKKAMRLDLGIVR